MKKPSKSTIAGKQYASAHDMHYKTKNLDKALDLYEDIMASHADTSEAEYSRTQIQNIAKGLVPKQELLDAEMAMARAHLNN